MSSEPAGPALAEIEWLRGVKVVEVTTAVSAPLIGRVLAELGAEVVKVESRAKPDVNRARLPRPTDPEGFPAHESFQLLHESSASKKSVTLNLKTDEGQSLFLKLLGDADVFIENFVPGWLDRLGLTVESLREKFPRLVILSASGYGQTGPLRTQRSYAPVMSALAGVEGLIGYDDGQVMGCSALALADLNCSFTGVFLVAAALKGREQTGHGTHVDLSQIEAASTLAGEAFVEAELNGSAPLPRGNADPDGTPWTLIPTERPDEWIAAVDTQSGTLAEGELLELKNLPAGRRSARETLLERLRVRGIEAAPVLTPTGVAKDRGFAARGFTQTVQHPHAMIGEVKVTSVPWHLDGRLPRVLGAAPLLGGDNPTILSRFVDAAGLADFEAKGVLR
ncbi:CaiB/BaiF CoA-transferase family protein [Arthrobacter sp. ISL-72]|uniref:CaiB/BaiF CoA transferase family protein n=1 Tax=Arthrobacter sp. ISL-72 TaxID=2819114 RepID=UPI001BEC90B1|nr:CoA transferase [Arthrobacter sp. ISL-72]MBT2597854.1 CoA transferase [Arthrobacter sp. ISL-72]